MGFGDAAIKAAWPRWWSDAADESASARTELNFTVARRLGLEPRSLLDDQAEPTFVWQAEARFKHLTVQGEHERAGIDSFGRAVATAIGGQLESRVVEIRGRSALDLRQAVLSSSPHVGLGELLALAWGVGIPVAYLRVFPWRQKRMAAMTVHLPERPFVLIGKDAMYPAWIAFYVAHELGHIALGHVGEGEALVDLETDEELASAGDDLEERQADDYALELLAGSAELQVLPETPGVATAGELARTSLSAGQELGIEAGTVALSYGHSTGDWRTAAASMKQIYARARPVWEYVNEVAAVQLGLLDDTSDNAWFLREVLGVGELA